MYNDKPNRSVVENAMISPATQLQTSLESASKLGPINVTKCLPLSKVVDVHQQFSNVPEI